MNFNEEIYEKAMKAINVEELFSMARNNNIPISWEQAKTYFELLNPTSGELVDHELENMAGGYCSP